VGDKKLEHVSDLLSPYLDDQVTIAERQAVEGHVRECPQCRLQLDELRNLTAALGSLPARPAPRSFVIGPRAIKPAALSGTPGGLLRAVSSIAASLLFVALSVNLAVRGLPRQAAAISVFRSSEIRPQAAAASGPPLAAARAASSGAPAAAAQPAAASARAVGVGPGTNTPAPAAPAAEPAPPAIGAGTGASPPAASTGAAFSPSIDWPVLATELGLLAIALVAAAYSVRWWRR